MKIMSLIVWMNLSIVILEQKCLVVMIVPHRLVLPVGFNFRDCGPEVTLELEGQFWHSRGFVLGSAATWLNARIPEISEVLVNDKEELQDYEEITDKTSGDVIFRIDKRSADYDGDRG